jgi:hypothetical protein
MIRLALDTPFIGGVSIQPQFGSGRSGAIDPMNRLTHTGVLGRLGKQTGGLVTWRDLTALPCSHPHCCSVGYMLRTADGTWKSLVGIIGRDRLKGHLDLIANRINDPELSAQLRGLLKEALLGLLSEQSSLSHPSVARIFRDVCESCDLGLSTLVRLAGDALVGNTTRFRRLVSERIKRITIKPFMDMSTMLEERLLQCCVHVGTQRGDAQAEHQCVPFCAAQAWPQLSAMKLAEVARTEAGRQGLVLNAAIAAAGVTHGSVFPQASDSPALPPSIRFSSCVYTTAACSRWLVSPPVMVMAMSGLGLWAYWRAVRGLTRSKCVLPKPAAVCSTWERCSRAEPSALY